MANRPSHLPKHSERIALQMLRERGELTLRDLYPTSVTTIKTLLAKGWIELTPIGYRSTQAGTEALRAPLPKDYRPRS